MYKTLDEGLQHLDVHKSYAREVHRTHTDRVHMNCKEHAYGHRHEKRDYLVFPNLFVNARN